jgi:hypothetical protein
MVYSVLSKSTIISFYINIKKKEKGKSYKTIIHITITN